MRDYLVLTMARCRSIGEWLLPRKKYQMMALVFFVLLIGFAWMLTATPTYAIINEIVNGMIRVLSYVMLSVAHIAIGFTLFFLRFFINLASYNGYIDAPIVVVGWTMVRDIANMFFVVIMLVIAFATILGLEQYEYRKLLVKLLLMAIFINFSNMIAQLVIDIAHVFTITFLNAISAAAGGNLINMFKLEKIVSIVGATPDFTSAEDFGVNILVASMAATFFAILSATTMGAYAIAMAIRVVVLWTLIILSPFAFVLAVLPATQDKAKQWWSEFSKHVIAAPVMVFFLWLAFATLGQGDAIQQIEQGASERLSIASAEPPKLSLSEVTSWENMASFFVAMAFLWIGIQKVQELGITGGSIIGSSLNFAKKVATIATGYAAGRWLVGKGKEVGKGALWYAPLIGGEKWALRGKLVGQAVKGWYHDKGYALTKKGEQMRLEAEDLHKKLGETEDEGERKAIQAQIAEKEKAMSKEGAGGLLGWAARSGIQLEKQVSKTEKQATFRKDLLWKRIGSEAGGVLLKTDLFGLLKDADGKAKYLQFGIGMGTKGLPFGLLGDRALKDKELGKIMYTEAGMSAMDRVERGWFAAEEERSKAKDREFEGLGKRQGLSRARLKFDVSTGNLTYQIGKGSLLDQIAQHKLGEDIHTASLEQLQQAARLNVVKNGVRAGLGKGGDYHDYLTAHSLANFKKMEVAATEEELVKRDDIEFRTHASEAYNEVLELEKEIADMHSDAAQPAVDKIKALEKRLVEGGLSEPDRKMVEQSLKEAKQDAERIDIEEANARNLEQKKTVKRGKIDEKLKASPAWRYAAAKARAWLAGELEKNTESELMSQAKQKEVYDERGISTPTSAFAELVESFRKEFKDMPFEQAVANQGKVLATLHKKRQDGTLKPEEEQIAGALSMALYQRLNDQSWVDDNVYGMQPTSEMRKLLKETLGSTWENRDVMDLDTLGNIHAAYASAMDMDFVAKDEFVRQLLAKALEIDEETGEFKHKGLNTELVYEGLRTGRFVGKDQDGNEEGDYTEELRSKMQELMNQRGAERLTEIFKQVFTDKKSNEFYEEFMKKVRELQPRLEVFGNARDAALQSTHPENAGWYQSFEVGGQRMYIPVSGRQAEDYVLGDMKKIGDKRKLLAYQFHGWADVVQGAFGPRGIAGQGILRIRPQAYSAARSNITDGRAWESSTTGRSKKVLAGLLAHEEVADYKDNQGYYVIGGARNEKGKRWGLLEDLTYLNEGGKYKNADGTIKDEKDRRKAALDHLFDENFIHQLRYGGRDLLYTLATQCGITTYEADTSGKIKLKIKMPDGRDLQFDTINELIKSLNGDLGEDRDLGYTKDNKLQELSFSKEAADTQRRAEGR